MTAIPQSIQSSIVQRLRSTALDKDNFPRMNSEKWLPVGLAIEAADEIAALRAKVDELTAWRLVDTAPHETYVLLGWWDEGKWNCQTGMASHGWRRGAYSTMSLHGQATHWMPLPEGPAVNSQHSGSGGVHFPGRDPTVGEII